MRCTFAILPSLDTRIEVGSLCSHTRLRGKTNFHPLRFFYLKQRKKTAQKKRINIYIIFIYHSTQCRVFKRFGCGLGLQPPLGTGLRVPRKFCCRNFYSATSNGCSSNRTPRCVDFLPLRSSVFYRSIYRRTSLRYSCGNGPSKTPSTYRHSPGRVAFVCALDAGLRCVATAPSPGKQRWCKASASGLSCCSPPPRTPLLRGAP